MFFKASKQLLRTNPMITQRFFSASAVSTTDLQAALSANNKSQMVSQIATGDVTGATCSKWMANYIQVLA